MIQLPEERRPPLTPQLALRVAVLGTCALAMFAIIFFRLWFLQVLSGPQYLLQASVNRVRNIQIAAPRGEVVDRNGALMVQSRAVPAVLISPPDLPVPMRATRLADPPVRDVALYDRLARILGMPTKRARCRVIGVGVVHLSPIACTVAQQYAVLPYSTVTIKTDVPTPVQFFLRERPSEFPGVQVQQVWLRKYPLTTLAAQLFGIVGRITPAEVGLPRYRGVSQNAIVGQSGLEWYYDKYLRGTDGLQRVQVDALGNFEGNLPGTAATQGLSLKLAIDTNLQRAGQAALEQAISSNYPAAAGAFVAMNPDNGEVYAMGSLPTYDPTTFTRPEPQSTYAQLATQGHPLVNRAIQSAYPTGSTFKAITATAALHSGAWSLGETYNDTGVYMNGPTDTRHNAGHAAYGVLDIVNAIKVSSDNFFYNLGALLNSTKPNGGALQDWARMYGMGQQTGIDVGGETKGILPTPNWRSGRDKLELQCEQGTGPFKGKGHHTFCGIADGRPWSVGDNENLAVGQGDLEATPLQLAVAYAALANDGKVVRPHVGLEIDYSDGTLFQRIQPPPARHLHFNEQYRSAILSGLRAAASQPGGTSADVFAGFPVPVYGKTGTAERGLQANQSWYVCFVPSSVTSKPILVVVTVEQGGFGAQAAAPAARQILSQWFFGKRGPFVSGQSKTL
ncbi:MAG: penicillin-binding transpeptidase domain-containing protein [Actinomycetota bacterium]|nr:penicillin-binding transpeptidase domain-containing protein [Actinomycetota bacterium]